MIYSFSSRLKTKLTQAKQQKKSIDNFKFQSVVQLVCDTMREQEPEGGTDSHEQDPITLIDRTGTVEWAQKCLVARA